LQRSNIALAASGNGNGSSASTIEAEIRRAANKKETAMKLFPLTRFLRTRRVYWSVLQELSAYTDRELLDIGIDRVDIPEIARLASREKN
jgi:uncharacterized protein YjiS (DUF1127 family)